MMDDRALEKNERANEISRTVNLARRLGVRGPTT